MPTEQKVAVITNLANVGEPAGASGARTDAASKQEILLERLSPEYWRVTLDNPPFNIFGPQTIPQLHSVIAQIETDPKVKVVVFQSAVPGFFLTHYDFVPPLSATTSISPGATGLPALPDILVRLSRAPARWKSYSAARTSPATWRSAMATSTARCPTPISIRFLMFC
jgi:hypothetical protein